MVHCQDITGPCMPQVPSDFSTLPHQLSRFQDEIVSRAWLDLCPVGSVACACAQKLFCAAVMWLGVAQFGGWEAGCGCVCGLCTLAKASSL
jgi:hypothetical protein